MCARNLLKESQQLTSNSLESFIADVTSEGQNLDFYSLFAHPHISTVNARYKQMLRLFSQGRYEDYKSYKEQHQQLTERQLATLKRLTLLSEFRGKNTVSMLTLENKIDSSEDELLSLLMKMSIDGTIVIKIDQETNQLSILHSELRAKALDSSSEGSMVSKIEQIQVKNSRIREQLKQIGSKEAQEGYF